MRAMLPDRLTCLLDVLGALPPERPLLREAERCLSAASVMAQARRLRRDTPAAAGQVRLLHGLSPLDLLVQLVAWDGFCRRLVLLPAALEPAAVERLAATVPAGEDQKHPVTEWLLATSGTTGHPKLIVHTLAGLSQSLKRDEAAGARFRWGLVYDPCRFAGLQVALQALLSGAELVLTPADFEGQVRALVAGRVNALSATPTQWRKFLMDGRLQDCPLRQITLGGEIADQKLLDHLRQRFPTARITHIYASTEAGVGFAVTDGRAGFPLEYVARGTGRTLLRIDGEGGLWLRTAMAPAGHGEGLTDAQGYLNSLDLVEVRGDRVFFLGRKNGVINIGGNKVHPETVEEVLRELTEVSEARVWGKKNPLTGELVVAEVVPADLPAEENLRRTILAHCRRRLDPWQVPALVRFVERLEVMPAGKLRRTGD